MRVVVVALWPLVYLAEEGVMDNEEFTGRFLSVIS